jgi:hypothetical protein
MLRDLFSVCCHRLHSVEDSIEHAINAAVDLLIRLVVNSVFRAVLNTVGLFFGLVFCLRRRFTANEREGKECDSESGHECAIHGDVLCWSELAYPSSLPHRNR